MSEVVIRVEDLGKLYRIGTRRNFPTLRDEITQGLAKPIKKVKGLLKREFGEKRSGSDNSIWALKDISFEVRRGEVVGIIGRNGAGKSTLLKILSKITEPTKGYAEISGRIGSLLEVGTGFHPELTGRENIYLNGALLGMRKRGIDQKFDEIVAFAEIDKFLDTPVKHYSSGMYVRLAFAVAAHLEPEILLVDEVLAVGDAAFQKKCLGKMGDVAREGRTVLFVSHNMVAIQHLCTRGFVLENGSIAFAGCAREGVEKYLGAVSDLGYGFADLRDHVGRPSGMQPIIQSIGLLSDGNLPRYRDKVKTGESVVFEIRYDCQDLRLDYAMLGICSLLGERVCTVGTHLSPNFGEVFQDKGVLECKLPYLPLAEGEYTLAVAVGTRMPPRNIDYVENAIRFRVECGDYFGTGATLLRGQGYIAQRSEWKVASNFHDK